MNVQVTLADQTFGAAIWVIGGKLVAKSLDFITLIVLARFLSPADFGLVAMAMTVVLVTESVLELPLFQALVRVPNPSKLMFDTAFTLSILRSVVIALLLGSLSWPISILYREPRLVLLICALSTAPMLRGSLSPRMVLFVQKMDFRREFVLDCSGKLIAVALSTIVAVKTESYWAIVVGTVSTPMVMNILSYVYAPYSPRFSLSEWSRFSNMVGWNSASQLMTAINWQMDRLILGRLASEATFGRFTIANDLTAIPVQALVNPINRPLLAAFTPLQDPSSFGSAYCRASNAVFAIASPIMVSMSFLAEPAIRVVLGNRWLEAAPLLHWFALIYLIALPVAPVASLAMAVNRTRIIAVQSAIELAVKFPIVLTAILTFGVMGVVAGRAIVTVIMTIVSMMLVTKLTGTSLLRQFLVLWRTSIALSAMAVGLFLLSPLVSSEGDTFLVGVSSVAAAAAACVVYLSVLFILWHASQRPAGIEETVLRALNLLAARFRPHGARKT